MKPPAIVLVSLVVALSSPGLALALEAPTDCPPGSVGKVSGAFAFCEPSVCIHDGNCAPGEVCRNVPLCVEVGTLADSGQKGEDRLMATQRCGAGGSCPSNQTCSTKDRCLTKEKAQKLGLLEAPAAAPSQSSAATSTPEAKKSACGCDVPGLSTRGQSGLGIAIVGAVIGAVVARRKQRPCADV